MSDLPNLPVTIRGLLRLTTKTLDICYDCRSGLKDAPAHQHVIIERTTDHLCDLRDVLEKLFKATTAASTVGADSPAIFPSLNVVTELFSKCEMRIMSLEGVLEQGALDLGKGLQTTSSSPNLGVIFDELALSTIDLKSLVDGGRKTFASTNDHHSVTTVNSFIDSRHSTVYNVSGAQVCNLGASNDADKLRRKIQAWLSAPDPSSNYNDALKNRGPKTGLWYIDGDMFKEWKTSAHSFGWIHGIPGCGKSVLCSTVIEDIAKYCQDNYSYALAYFYFDFTDSKKQKCTHLIRSLLRQLSSQFYKCPDTLVKLYTHCNSGEEQASSINLVRALKDIIACFHRVYIVIDALDECSDLNNLLDFLMQTGDWKLEILHVLATSRRERRIEDGLVQLVSAQMGLGSDLVGADIRIHLSAKLDMDARFNKWTAEELLEIKDTLIRGAHGMFRWVTCQLEVLANCSNLYKLRKALRTLPRTLEETYDRILLSIDKDKYDEALKLLQWLAFSARPLFLAEMAEVFAIDRSESIPFFDRDQRPREPRDILDICSSLVTISYSVPRDNYRSHQDLTPDSVVQSGTLSLAHLSVKEYLASERIKSSPLSFYHLSRGIADTTISRECLVYLLQFDTLDCLKNCTEATISFGRYAAEFWIAHARSEDRSIQNDVQPLISSLLLPQSQQFINWITLFDVDLYRPRKSLNSKDVLYHPIYYASKLGLDQIVDQLSSCNPADVNFVTGTFGTALAAASWHGHEAIVRLLLGKGSDVNLVPAGRISALVCASANGNEAIVRMLLASGAEVNLAVKLHGSALTVASSYGHEAIARLLLENGADVNLVGGSCGSALATASRYNHEGIVKMLLENGAAVNLLGASNYDSPLVRASSNGCEAIVRLLLESGANVNPIEGSHRSALVEASSNGHGAIVQLLLHNGANVDQVGETFGSALVSASHKGHESIARMLLESGADVNLAGEFPHHHALALASLYGHTAIVRLLLDYGADVNLAGGPYGSALISAIMDRPVGSDSKEDIVRLLLERGANVSLKDHHGSVGLRRNLTSHPNVVQLLLDHGADAKELEDIMDP